MWGAVVPALVVHQLWMLAPFLRQLEKRQHEPALIAEVARAATRLREQAPGLNLEQLKRTPGDRTVWSIRATRAVRVLLVEIRRGSIGLLHFDSNHDAAYRWLDTHLREVDGYCGNQRQWRAAATLDAPLPGVRASADEALAVRGGDDIEAMLQYGIEHYLASLDGTQAPLASLPIVGREGPVVVRGGAGTGKTALAISRVKYLAERPEMGYRQALYLCFSSTLKKAVAELVSWHYGGTYPKQELVVQTFHGFCTWYLGQRATNASPGARWDAVDARSEYPAELVASTLAGLDPTARDRIVAAIGEVEGSPADFIASEIVNVVWPSGVQTREEYLELERTGMKARLRRAGREAVWEVFEALRATRAERKWTFPELVEEALAAIEADPAFIPYRGVVVDEAQDCGRSMVRLARRLAAGDERRLFFLVDPNQGIFPNGFQWAAREIQPRGRQIRPLRKTYRNTVEIQEAAAALLAESDPQYAAEPSQRHGPQPELVFASSPEGVVDALVERVRADLEAPAGVERPWQPAHIGILAPTRSRGLAIRDALVAAGVPARFLGEERAERYLRISSPEVKVMTLHAAKGLDFPLVYLAHLGEKDLSWLDADTQRALLYVGMTRAAYRLTIIVAATDTAPILRELDVDAAFKASGPALDDGLLRLRSRYPTLEE